MASIKKTLYDHGLPFSECLGVSLDEQTKRVGSRKASLIIVDGGVGQGKTTLAVHIADYIQGTPINLKTQIGLGGMDFVKKLYSGIKKGIKVMIYDEAGDFDRKGAISRFNKMLNRIFDTYRTFEIVVILVLPCFKVLEDSLFDKKIPRLLVNSHSRSDLYGNIRAYSLYRMYQVKWWMKKLKVPPQAYNKIYPNFRGNFLDLDKKRSDELDQISTDSKSEVLKEYNIGSDGLLTYKDIASQLNMSGVWVRREANALGLKAEHIHKKVKYFKDDVLDALEKRIGGSKE